MTLRLKKLRIDASMTQAQLAAAAAVTQPTYQRWETERSAVPADKLELLAKALSTTASAILGHHPPVKVAFYDNDAPENLQYYGEAAFHFSGRGNPLLISISEAYRSGLHSALQKDDQFVIAKSLSNQIVIIRRDAIADVYFSSEAYDDYGPEEESYFRSPLIPDPRDWEIIEAIYCDDVGLEDFDEANVSRISDLLQPTSEEEFAALIESGDLRAEDVPAEKARERQQLETTERLSKYVTVQMSSGKRRDTFAFGSEIYQAFWSLIKYPEGPDNEFIHFSPEGYHRSILINPRYFDYISIPAHKWEEGEVEAYEDSEPEPSVANGPKLKSRRPKSA